MLITVVQTKAKDMPGIVGPIIGPLKTVIQQTFGNPKEWKLRLTDILIYALIVAVLCVIPALVCLFFILSFYQSNQKTPTKKKK